MDAFLMKLARVASVPRYKEFYFILTARKLELKQKFDEAGRGVVLDRIPHHPCFVEFLPSLQFTGGQNAEKLFACYASYDESAQFWTVWTV